jgi:hypothetical protein
MFRRNKLHPSSSQTVAVYKISQHHVSHNIKSPLWNLKCYDIYLNCFSFPVHCSWKWIPQDSLVVIILFVIFLLFATKTGLFDHYIRLYHFPTYFLNNEHTTKINININLKLKLSHICTSCVAYKVKKNMYWGINLWVCLCSFIRI